MNQSYPIFTIDAECQDCFKCVRHCPVKAIKVEGGHASVIPELCVACGHCVEVCPAHAKKIRNDLVRARQLLQSGRPVFASLAPSWVSEFKGLPAGKMVAALRRLGFAGVSETALGAQIVSEQVASELSQRQSGLVLSSACPVAVDFVRKYLPEFTDCISPVFSPALAHASFLRQQFGADIEVIFIGPCIAKKNEADRHPELMSLALIFPRLRQWFRDAGLDPWSLALSEADHFVPDAAEEGNLYPVEGGMIETIRARNNCQKVNFSTVSGLPALKQLLDGLHPEDIKEPVFIESLACVGACVHGPGTEHGSPGLLERLRIVRNSYIQKTLPPRPQLNIKTEFSKDVNPEIVPSLDDIQNALRRVGKYRPEDELNCGGCGYDSCNNFARALLCGKAEPNMCVSYLRQLAQKKSNAILRCIPAAVLIVDRQLRLIECNQRFAEFCGDDAIQVFSATPGMGGAQLEKLLPFTELFTEVLESRVELSRELLRVGKRLLSLKIFNIDPGQVIGAMLFDVTDTEFQREQIADQAREVIHKNLATVQDIACKLGEHMAETEILLRSIADNYADQKETKTSSREI